MFCIGGILQLIGGSGTRFSDDLLWLPYVTAEYINSTGDKSILSEKIKFLKGEPLQPGEIERYTFYESTDNTIIPLPTLQTCDWIRVPQLEIMGFL